MSDIPLFPLNVVLMPGAPQPLHIFEERYKQMINECLQEESEFGMVLADEEGTREVGCTARIVELVERYADGRMVIMVEGARRFKLNNVLTGKPYYVGEIEYIEERQQEEDFTELAEECVALLQRVVEAATEGSVDIEVEPPYRNLSFAIAGRIEFDLETRQQILELKSEIERLEKLKELLSAAAERMERERKARDMAQTNGHLRGDWSPGEQRERGLIRNPDEDSFSEGWGRTATSETTSLRPGEQRDRTRRLLDFPASNYSLRCSSLGMRFFIRRRLA